MTDTFGTLRAGQSAARAAVAPVLTVIEPEAFAPLGRLGEWLFASGARLTMVRPWQGDPVPDLTEIGDGLVVLGGAMSVHDDDCSWLRSVDGACALYGQDRRWRARRGSRRQRRGAGEGAQVMR